ncbi:SDR family NAD(P)-dependent oxidoreductase [Chitinophaga arvensicola]|uniref:NAD(P)-dependent dehydrogenase, short-chain alcohol dehydrogenase family n=1 Tax=Chitinophaga arvensicola TaxID=29529 RepID=A0A1I0SA28_9BACT|nr:SDR family oxidoreductase [Chitinophaga arvensicola]SEW53082.1 NAD(P)-dependent dehydrogenase, short-chain alcohol dehydrogenase family [Chitinophaga arvensicola]
MDLQLRSKTAFVSGSTQGIGFAIARQLLEEGADVIINGRTSGRVAAAVKQLEQEVPGASVSGIAADFSDAAAVDALLAELPHIDILVNNVGIFELREFTELSDDDWHRCFNINVLSGVRLSKYLLPRMLEKQAGRIIFISSEAGVNVPGNMIHYGVSKTAMMALSRGLATLTKNTGVTVNTVVGGPAYSEGVATAIEQIAAAQQQPVDSIRHHIFTTLNPSSLIQRFIEPAEIAHLVAYLASPLSVATNGAAIRADGGVLNTIF